MMWFQETLQGWDGQSAVGFQTPEIFRPSGKDGECLWTGAGTAQLCCGNRSLSQGVQTVCKAVKKTNFLVKQFSLFLQFTWQGLRQMLLNTLFCCQRGWCLPPPQATRCYRVVFSPSVLVLLSFLPSEVHQHDITFIWYLNGWSGVCNDISLLREDDVVKWDTVTKTDGANLESVCKILQHLIKMVV